MLDSSPPDTKPAWCSGTGGPCAGATFARITTSFTFSEKLSALEVSFGLLASGDGERFTGVFYLVLWVPYSKGNQG